MTQQMAPGRAGPTANPQSQPTRLTGPGWNAARRWGTAGWRQGRAPGMQRALADAPPTPRPRGGLPGPGLTDHTRTWAGSPREGAEPGQCWAPGSPCRRPDPPLSGQRIPAGLWVRPGGAHPGGWGRHCREGPHGGCTLERGWGRSQPGSGMPPPPGPQPRADRLQQVAANSCGRSVPVQLSTRQAPSTTHLPARGSPWPLHTRGCPVSGRRRAPGVLGRQVPPHCVLGNPLARLSRGPAHGCQSGLLASPGARTSRQG